MPIGKRIGKWIGQNLKLDAVFFRCPHSKKFESTWKQFAEMKQNTDLHVAEVKTEDCLNEADH